MPIFTVALLSGISYGAVLFLVAIGLSLIMGLMGIVNLAHGALFITGAYTGLLVAKASGNLLLGVIVGGCLALALGLAIERGLIRTLYGRQLQQILVTVGVVYIVTNVHLWIYGGWPKSGFIPPSLSATFPIGTFQFSVYRLALIAIGIVAFFVLRYLQDRTRVGIVVRAGMDDEEMTGGLGINLTPFKVGTFLLGAFLAGCAGVLGPPVLGGINLGTATDMFIYAIAVCIVGGIGSVQGTLAGAMVIGIATILFTTFVPAIGTYIMYILIVLVLIFKPAGLVARGTR